MLIASVSPVFAQAAPAHQPAPRHRYCQPQGGFCFEYPGSWKMLGDVFNGNGVVVAPLQAGEESGWDEITVATIAPPASDGQQPVGLDGIIQRAADAMRAAGEGFQTLQRREQTVDGKPAQMLKAQYTEKGTTRSWVEQIVFIEGPDDEIYSVALKCSPQSLTRLQPALSEVLKTWYLPKPIAPSVPGATTTAPH